MTIIPQNTPDVNPARKTIIPKTYTEVAKEAERLGFTLGRARRSGAYPLMWTTTHGNRHVFVKSLDKVLPFIELCLANGEIAEGGAK